MVAFGEILDNVDQMNPGQLKSLQRVINARWVGLSQQAKARFHKGCYVRFTDKYGELVYGTVTKVCQKNIKIVSTCGLKWTVSPTFLTKVESLPGW